jgi:guanine deaminase
MAERITLKEAMAVALQEATRGVRLGHGGPFGAVVLKNGVIISQAHNTVVRDSDPTAHAEVNALRLAAKKLGDPWLKGCRLVATSEPCPLCLAAAYWARIKEIRFGLPQATAAKYGFADVDFQNELRRPAARRRLASQPYSAWNETIEQVMADWQANQGQKY